jgi:hypothetical protein
MEIAISMKIGFPYYFQLFPRILKKIPVYYPVIAQFGTTILVKNISEIR